MPKVSLVVIMLLQAVASFAQNYFVFIGSDNRQPFYIRVDSEFHSSSAEGHLILSQLKDSTYDITLGFPGQTQPEQHYSFRIDGKDQAFELRRQDPDGLRLYNLQNNQWLSPEGGGVATGEARSAGVKKDDAFSRMMAGVVHDTAVLYNTYAMEQALSDSPDVATQSAPAQSADAQSASTQSATAQSANATQSIPARSPGTRSTGTQSIPARSPGIQSTGTPLASPSTAHANVLTPAQSTPRDTATTTTTTAANSTATATKTATAATNTALATHTATATTTTAAITAPPATHASPDSATGKSTDTTIAAAARLATSPINSTAVAANPAGVTADTTAARPAGVISHQPAARFNDSGTATPRITKLSEHHTTKNVRLVYALQSGSKKADTIDVVIPVDSPAMAKTAGHSPHTADSSHLPAGRPHVANADSPIVNPGTAYRPTVPPTAPAEATRPHPADSSHKPGKSIGFVNSDCHDFASDFDVDRLRVRMLEFSKDEERIAAARKEFKIRCFYTRQIRALSDVFTSDAAKFHFFEAAWPFAADEHFHQLSDLLTDPIYIARFKTMTHQQ
jgi:hypothetical protein